MRENRYLLKEQEVLDVKKKIAYSVIVGVIIVILGVAFVYPLIESKQIDNQFALAKEQIESGDKDEGIKIFVSIKDKKDDDILDYFNTYINELCSKKDFSEAESVMSALILNDVLESNEVLSDNELTVLKQKIDNEKQKDIYEQAEQLVSNKKYTDAYFKYMQIEKYKDSTEKAAELVENYKEEFYGLAISSFKKGTEEDLELADNLFIKLGYYKDSDAYFKKVRAARIDMIDSDIENTILTPAIGMTAEQVEASTWGKPKDINKTTYSWGVKEQWVYSGYRYIYLEDGIVTAIQE